MKKIICFASAFALLALLAVGVRADGAQTPQGRYVFSPDPTDRLNLRTEPRKSALSLGKYYSGTAVTLLGEEKNGYVKVRVDPLEGWMDIDFVVPSVEAYCDARPTTTVVASSAALRELPSTDSTALKQIGFGETVVVLGVRADSWLHVQAGGRSGFMHADLLADAFSFHKGDSAQAPSGGSSGAANTAVVNNPDPKTRLNLRAEPNGDAEVLGKYFSGVSVTLLDTPKDGWAHVQIAGTATGYMQTKYLAMNGERVESAMLTPKIQNKGGTGLNLRQMPSASAQSLGLYKNGTQVTVMGVYGGWVHVTVDGKTGYMQADKFDTQNGLTYEQMK